MRMGGCGDCARVDPCKALFASLFGRMAPPQPRRAPGESRPADHGESPFLAFLGQVARAFEEGSGGAERRDPRPRRSAPQGVAAAAPAGTFRREVEQRLEPLLERGAVRIEAVARALGCSRQTLYRRLREEGTTFAALLDGLRRRLALLYLREQGLSVKETAYRLGFSEPAAFSRAYKRWTGSSPRRMNS
jgi:AraC-like DNA-binding protein